jgi:DNA-binding NtrC family response regulator
MEKKQYSASQSLPLATELTRARNTPTAVKNRLEALTILINSALIELEELQPPDGPAVRDKINFDLEVERFEADLIRCALMKSGGIQRRAAALLNIKVTTLNAKIKRLGISPHGIIKERQFS